LKAYYRVRTDHDHIMDTEVHLFFYR